MQMKDAREDDARRNRTERAMSLDDVPINGRSDRTWEALIALHLDGDGADGFDGSDGFARGTTGAADEEESTRRRRTVTPTKSFLKKGSRAMRTSPLTPRSSGGTPRVERARARVESGRRAETPPATPTTTRGRAGGRRPTSVREENGAREGRGIGLFDQDVNVHVRASTVETWREHKAKTARETRAFEALEREAAATPTRATRSEARAAVKTDDEGAAAPVVRDFLSSPTAEEEEARAAFERAKEQLERERGRFAEERATWEAGRVEAEEAFKAECDEVRRQFKREKDAMMRQAEAHLALPTREERNEAKFLRQQLERNEEEFKAERHRAKLTVDRLRQQIVDLNQEISELRLEKRMLEEKCEVADRLRAKASAAATPPRCAETVDVGSPASVQRAPTASTPSTRSRFNDHSDHHQPTFIAPRTLSIHDPVPSVSDKSRLFDAVGAIREFSHEDGRIERVFADGARVVTFTNGTVKEIARDDTTTVYFTNGDVKRAHNDGIVEYYYRDVDTWHTTHPSGVELYHFAHTDQVELHAAGEEPKEKHILFSDGTIRVIHADGREEDIPAVDRL